MKVSAIAPHCQMKVSVSACYLYQHTRPTLMKVACYGTTPMKVSVSASYSTLMKVSVNATLMKVSS